MCLQICKNKLDKNRNKIIWYSIGNNTYYISKGGIYEYFYRYRFINTIFRDNASDLQWYS